MRGRVKWWTDGKGFGYVAAEDGRNVRLSRAELPPPLGRIAAGTLLEFDVVGRPGRGYVATRVRLVEVAQEAEPAVEASPGSLHRTEVAELHGLWRWTCSCGRVSPLANSDEARARQGAKWHALRAGRGRPSTP